MMNSLMNILSRIISGKSNIVEAKANVHIFVFKSIERFVIKLSRCF